VGRLLAMLFPATTAMYALFNGISAIVLPAQVERIDPASKVGNLALLTVLMAVASMIAIPTGGAIADRTRTRFGRRAPWLAMSAVASAVLAVLMGFSSSLATLAVVATALWFTANFFQGALTAIMPDRVPVGRRGVASSVIGGATPVGVILAVNYASHAGQVASYTVFGVALVVTTALLLLGARERSARDLPRARRERTGLAAAVRTFFQAFASRDFRLAFFSRFGLFASYFTVSGYAFYTFQDYIGTDQLPGHDAAVAVSTSLTVTIVTWVLVAFVAGWLADRLNRRKVFVGISALGVAVSMVIPVVFPTWTGMLVYSACIGASIGTYFAVDLAVMSLVLPEKESEGRDFGILQVATGMPQLLAPVVAGALITWLGGYPALFAFGAVCAIVSGLLMFRIRSVR
jgi:MFS family permease